MWMMPLHLHVNQKSDYDMMIMIAEFKLLCSERFIHLDHTRFDLISTFSYYCTLGVTCGLFALYGILMSSESSCLISLLLIIWIYCVDEKTVHPDQLA